MSKNIWILNHYALTPEMSGGTRHYDFAKELIKRGYNVTIIASSFHYSKYKEMKSYKKNEDFIKEEIDGITFIWFKTPAYRGNGVDRILNMLNYMKKSIILLPKIKLEKPDIIIGSSVHLFAVMAAYRLSKKYKVPFIMEVRDLWPQTLIDLGISKWHPFILLLGRMERFLYKKADKIVTSLPRANIYIKTLNIKEDKIIWISNGTAIREDENFVIKLDKNKFNVLYTGSHGLANDLQLLLKAVKMLKENEEIHFTLVGDGPLRDKLIKEAEKSKLNNITFISSVAKNEVFEYLKSADLLYVGLKNLPLYKYGMSMNKVFDYFSSQKPILFVSNIEENIVDIANAGKVIKNAKIKDIVESIVDFSQKNKKELNILGKNGFNYLLENFTIKVLTNKWENLFEEIIDKD